VARIIQQYLFSWQDINLLGDLERLWLVIKHLPDEVLMRILEKERGNGRDDYPVRAVWNSILAGIVYGHPSIASLRRELLRNAQLRELCGFDPAKGEKAVPPAYVYTRFLKRLMEHQEDIDALFDRLVLELGKVLPEFGKHLAGDSKGVRSFANKRGEGKRDGRREKDANWGKKVYRGKREDGSLWEKIVEWFGFKLHLIVDVETELPVYYEVTKASVDDMTRVLPMVERLKGRHGWLVERAETCALDKGYDSEDNNRDLWNEYRIKPIIAIRDMWKDGEETHPLYEDRVDTIVYNAVGEVFCVCPETGEQRPMAYCGFESKRKCLKYRCPAAAYGFQCKGSCDCGKGDCGSYGRIVRIPLERNRRYFTPIARSSYAFKRLYRGRTAVERVNSRLDVSFGFEYHFIRGQQKMTLQCGIALIVMLGIALGRVKEKQKEYIRSLVKSPLAA
jgi:hypothetical protein